MKLFFILAGIAVAIVFLILIAAFICFYITFYSSSKQKKPKAEFDIPPGKVYEPYREMMIEWMKESRRTPHKDVEIKSFDGLALRGKYYEGAPDAPIELMLHGYRGSSERDMCGGMHRAFALNRNVLLADQRASGKSDGHVISFGINESRDCLAWVNYIITNINKDAKIILTGVSMGAATVMIASGMPLPKNVVGVLADCGYSSANEIIKKVIRDMHLPADLLYPFVKLGAKIYGRFDLEETSPKEAVKHCKVPIIFVHGDADDYVPCEMSKTNYEACAAPKQLTFIPGAGHGLCYPAMQEKYLEILADFFTKNGIPTEVVL